MNKQITPDVCAELHKMLLEDLVKMDEIRINWESKWEDWHTRLRRVEDSTTEIKLTLRSMNKMLMKMDAMMFGSEENDMQGIFERLRIAERRVKLILGVMGSGVSSALAIVGGYFYTKLTGNNP